MKRLSFGYEHAAIDKVLRWSVSAFPVIIPLLHTLNMDTYGFRESNDGWWQKCQYHKQKCCMQVLNMAVDISVAEKKRPHQLIHSKHWKKKSTILWNFITKIMTHFAGTMVSVLKISPVSKTLKPVAAAAANYATASDSKWKAWITALLFIISEGGKPNSHIKS